MLRCVALLAFASALVPVAEAGDLHSTYVTAAEVHLVDLLAPPPKAGSAAAKSDLDAVEVAVKRRTLADEERITAELPCTLDAFRNVLGANFTAARMPKTAGLIERVFQDDELIVLDANRRIGRARPYTLVPNLATFGHRSDSDSYPSGHATFGYLAATILARLVPEKRDALFAFADTYGRNRLMAGTHFPSDLEAGRITAAVIAEELLHRDTFERDLASAAEEVATKGQP